MNTLFLSLLLGLATSFCSANGLSGPFLFWGQEKVKSLQRNSLIQGDKLDFENLYSNAKAIVVFVRNSTNSRLDAAEFPQFQNLIHAHKWAYLPQRALSVEPFNYNANIELINLNNNDVTEDERIINGFNDAITLYGEDAVLGILANSEDETPRHFISKRENKEIEAATTTAQTPTSIETDGKYIYIATGKAVLYLNNAPVLKLSANESTKSIKLIQTPTDVTFSDQKPKGRLSILFIVEGEKLYLRFNFNMSRTQTWTMRSVKVEYKDFEEELTLTGDAYTLPSAPVKFSYRCGAEPLIFRNGANNLTLNDYQVQPWLNGSLRFGDVYDCVGFTTAPIWAGVLVTLFLCGILSIGLMALYDIKTPNKFESSRSKQLTFAVQE